MKGYRTAEWAAYRRRVIQLDDGVCSACGRGPADGVVLHVHHKQYIAGRLPWDYPFDACETLCSGCHAAKHGKVPPRTGWEFAGVDDLGDLIGTCELCGTSIRYVFMVDHPAWRPMEVGTDCCDNLISTEVATEFMESKRRHAERLKRFVSSSRWTVGPGDIQFIRHGKLDVEILPEGGQFRLRIDGQRGSRVFSEIFEARKFVFDMIESGQAKAYLAKAARRRGRGGR